MSKSTKIHLRGLVITATTNRIQYIVPRTNTRVCPGFFIGAKTERPKTDSGGGFLEEGVATLSTPDKGSGAAL